MRFSDSDALKRINSPKNSSNIELARNQEERLLMHSECILEKYNIPFWAYRNFTLWWQSLVTREKHNNINQLIVTPLSTVSIVEDIFKQIGKFRDAQDRYVSFEFSNIDFTNDYARFLEKMNDDHFWRERSMDALKTGICDIVVVDIPDKQTTFRPEPYQYLVSPSMMIDLEISKFTGNVEYFAYRQNKFKWDSALNNSNVSAINFTDQQDVQKAIFIDDDFYRVYVKGDGQWALLSKNEHSLGYCPCIDFWQPSISGTDGINKKGILTNLLSKLDKYLFYSALVSYMDISGAFPIFITYAMEEAEYDDKNKQLNYGNYYSPSTTSYLSNSNDTAKDPRTSYTWMSAPGSVMEYTQPADSSDANFVKDNPKWINPDVDLLKNIPDRCKKLEREIIQYATGENLEYMNEIAKNQDMSNASFNKQDSILTLVKRQVERVHKFCTKTKAIIRYGEEYFIGCTIDYGSDYFLKDANKIVEEYKSSKDAGISPQYSAFISKEAINTRFKNNPELLARMRIFNDLIPYQDKSYEELKALEIDKNDVINFIIWANSGNFISRFELEYGDIVKFAEQLEYKIKISLIKSKFKEYVSELRPEWGKVSKTVNA